MKRYLSMLRWLCLLFFPLNMAADNYSKYTEERPLTIVCDWELRPYEYMNSSGEPSGYNIEVMELIFERLGIPYRFLMREWHEAARLFESHEVDLIHSMTNQYQSGLYVYTKKFVNFYTLCVARRLMTAPYPGLAHLDSTSQVALKSYDYASLTIEAMDSVPCRLSYHSAKDALTGVRTGRYDYFIWGEEPMKLKIKELALDSLAIDESDIPAGELHIIGYDRELIDLIDDEYARLEQDGEIQKINDRWFHPERQHDDASPITVVILVAIIIAIVVVLLLGLLMQLRVRTAVRRNTDLRNMMLQALQIGDYYVLSYDIKTDRVNNAYGNLLPPEGMSEETFVQRIHPDEVEDFRLHLERIKRGDCEEWTLRKRWNVGTEGRPIWNVYEGSAILERENGKPRYVFHSFKDITHEVQAEQQNQEMTAIYKKAFDTNIIGISFYGADGHLIDFNEKMRELCEMTPEIEAYFRQSSLYDNPFTESFIQSGSPLVYHFCGHFYLPEYGIDKYVESRIRPLFDDEGQLLYYIITSRDVTAERDIYMQQREHDRRLKATNDQIRRYEARLNYLLVESKMWVFRFNIKEMTVTFSQTLRKPEFSETVEEYYAGLAEEYREEARQTTDELIKTGLPFHAIREFNYTPMSKEHTWQSIGAMPQYDEQGNITSYFGLTRDITDLMSVQQRLREETARAEDSGRLKSAFLANMTHEIRTPLNAIVGFSDVLQMIDDKDERMELIRIIRSNCDMLLRLINDILEASSMGQSLLVEPQEVDVPKVFDDICQTLAQRVEEVPFIKDNPCDTYVATLDKGRLQQLLTNFVTNAVKYTHEGHIRVGWRPEERDGVSGLYFYCEDTGAGIPRDKQAAVFDRFVKLNDFVQGTGLGLSICKAIVERCSGHIGVTSDGEGKGSTFWFWQPRILHVSNEEQGE